MNKIDNRKKKGFTLAELMLVIAITGILAAFGFIAVTRYMRVLEHMKYDAIAKEIFISAQNHLSMANNEGYLNTDDNKLGTKEGKRTGFEDITDDNSSVYYYVVNGKNDVDQTQSLISIMLPFGAIDETVRTEGSYIIRYNVETAQVLDVFYSEKTNARYGHEFSDLYTDLNDEGTKLMNLRDENGVDNKEKRRFYKKESNGSTSVIGYYGGTQANPLFGDKIPLPFIRVDNAEELKVTLKTPKLTETTKLQLYIHGELSGKDKIITLKESGITDNKTEYEVVLDSITRKVTNSPNEYDDINNFKNLFATEEFIPGENLIVYAEALDNTVLTNIAKTVEVKTNSLFGDNSTITTNVEQEDRVATITNIRHLENLESNISDVDIAGLFGSNPSDIKDHAIQEVNLDWNDFVQKTKSGSNAYIYGFENATPLATNYYYPVELKTNYNGMLYKISNVNVNHSGASGLFSTVNAHNISDLQLVDFNITGSGSTGALAGIISGSTKVSNVVAYENLKHSYISGGSTGGLIGYCENSTVERSAASVFVRGSNAGGLIGYATGSTVRLSYSGAHTENGAYLKSINGQSRIDVIGTNAGGLIGNSNGTTLSLVYSTASVDGSTFAGGLIGNCGNSTITGAYAVGYVVAEESNKLTKGGFVGNDAGGTSYSDSRYLLVANDGLLSAIGNKPENITIIKADSEKGVYNGFIESKINSACDAEPYDRYLSDVYTYGGKVKYQYHGLIGMLGVGDSLKETDFVKKHIGDWPDYELQVVNE